MPQDNPWPGVQALLKATRQNLERALRNMGQGWLNVTLTYAQSVQETGIKVVLGAARVDFDHVHDPKKLVGDMPETHQEWLEGMLLDSQLDELSVFRVKSFYGDDNTLPWPRDAVEMLLAAVQNLSDRLAAHALNAMGKTPRDVGYSNWMGNGPLAGWESLPLGYFSLPVARTPTAVPSGPVPPVSVRCPQLRVPDGQWHGLK